MYWAIHGNCRLQMDLFGRRNVHDFDGVVLLHPEVNMRHQRAVVKDAEIACELDSIRLAIGRKGLSDDAGPCRRLKVLIHPSRIPGRIHRIAFARLQLHHGAVHLGLHKRPLSP